tara:strand:+ start:2204 stop:4669 length:2466 start_codon:yes stop_codon:yes gene_type:complete
MRICTEDFTPTDEETKFFSNWKFELSNFQKWAIRAILNKNHALITAHTGSGKTLPAEAVILFYKSLGKKVIYTSPIKALTNQKFYDFSNQFPNISFGILTGDNKYNPEADVLLMTAEILRNTLFQKKMILAGKDEQKSLLNFDIDIDNELGCVIMDEAHYINDTDRGKVWEETIMMCPQDIPLLLLSATLSKPEKLASLIENRGGPEVFICPTTKRVVPLTHCAYITMPESNIKQMIHFEKARHFNMLNHFINLKDSDDKGGKFKDQEYENVKKTLKYIDDNKIHVNRFFVLNSLIQKLKLENLLPAIVFVFSRKQVDILASKIQVPLHEEGSKLPSIVRQECTKLLQKKLPNWKEYTNLKEFDTMVKLLEKGIAVHHAGVLKEFRELTELLFDKGYIKLLIATETFAVGINMPTKTTVFTSLEKFDGNGFRNIHPSEYTQMAGRAGRRGIDTKGLVVHLSNLISKSDISTQDYRFILTGPPKSITSQFQITPSLILNLLSYNNLDLERFVSKSMVTNEINSHLNELQEKLKKYDEYVNAFEFSTPLEILKEYNELHEKIQNSKNKERKKLISKRDSIVQEYYHIGNDIAKYDSILETKKEKEKIHQEIDDVKNWIKTTCSLNFDILKTINFIDEDGKINKIGDIANCLQEIYCFPWAECLINKYFNDISSTDLVVILSCFTNLKLSDENSVYSLNETRINQHTKDIIQKIDNTYNKYIDLFNKNKIPITENLDKHLNLCDIVNDWCNAKDENECKNVINECYKYDISLGDFVKAILKINNIATELEKAGTLLEDLELIKKIKEIPMLTLKHCVTNSSLYL